MALQSTPEVARQHGAEVKAEMERTSRQVQALWRRVGDDFNAGFERVAPAIIEVMNAAQERTAVRAAEYIPQVLDATGQSSANRPRFEIDARQWVGTAGDGYPTESLAYEAVIKAKGKIASGGTMVDARQVGSAFLATSMRTLVSDTARGVEGAATNARPIAYYVRQLQGESCGRCIILAGKRTRKREAFERHERCDCVNIPAAENIAGDMTTSPTSYLDSLDDNQLAKALGSKDNARAYREFGATPNQLVNAYRKSGGIKKAQVYGRNVKYTIEGTTRRGVAYHQMQRVRALSSQGLTKQAGDRYRRVSAPRLMPASIFEIAKDQSHATKLLRDHGWLGYTN